MKKKIALLTVLFGILITFWSCQNDNNPVEVKNNLTDLKLNKSLISSAKLYLYVNKGGVHNVNIHMLKEDWDSNEVSWYERTADTQWSNAGGTFYKQPISFVPNGHFEWLEIDILDFILQWHSGKPNYGIILEQDKKYPSVNFASVDHPNLPGYGPKLIINYTDGSNKTIIAKIDCVIWNTTEDTRSTDAGWLNVGIGTTVALDHRSLIKFDLPDNILVGNDNCTHTKAYWKTHARGKKKSPTWDLINPDGKDTEFFKSKKSYYKVLWTSPKRGNLYYLLAYEYIAAELNKLNGAEFSEISNAFDKATELFEKYTPKKIERLRRNNDLRKQFLELAKKLRNYNTGEIGPGHCDDYKWHKKDKEWKKWWKKKWGKKP